MIVVPLPPWANADALAIAIMSTAASSARKLCVISSPGSISIQCPWQVANRG
jgi:hypothetical protein